MLQPRWLQLLSSLGPELWLPLPLLGLVFWVGAGRLTEQVLNRAYNPKRQLQAEVQTKVRRPITVLPSARVLSIDVLVQRDQGLSQVTVNPANSPLKALIFEFPVTEFSQIEVAIAQTLGWPPEKVRSLVHYRVEE